MAKIRRTSSRKSKTQPKAKRRKKAGLPPDNPLQRHQELSVDRRVGSEGQQLAKLRLAALGRIREMRTSEETILVAPTPGISNWVQMGPTAIPKGQTYGGVRVLVTGRVTAIIVDPTNTNIIYVGAAQGGVWKTTDGGKNWVPKSDNEVSLATGALAMDPTDHLVLYAGTGEGNFSGDSYYGNGVLKSTNGGDTWTLQGANIFSGVRFGRIVVNPSTPTTVFAATTAGLYRTTNGGGSWMQITNGLPAAAATDVVVDPATPSVVYAAFWGQGIYRTTNANLATPTWTKLTGGLPTASAAAPAGFTRIALGISPSSPQTLYALFSNNDTSSPPPGPPYPYAIDKFYVSTNGGNAWTSIPLPGGPGTGIGGQGFYNLNVAVDPTTPDIVYLSGISLWKAVRNTVTGAWTITDIGGTIHPDNHAFAFDPTNHLVIYAGSDGGIYKSADGGATWSDTINEGLCITQFEFMEQHPTSDAVLFAGTQDNGTEQFRNSPVFYHSADGDGGFVAIDPNQPRNVIHEYYGPSPERSTQGGKWGDYLPNGTHLNWQDISTGLLGSGLFYPPFTFDQTNPNNIAFGTDRINLDSAQGTGGWPTKITLPALSTNERASAINYVNSSLIYAGTSQGKVYRLTKSGAPWTATPIHAAPLPARFIWDVAARPDDANTIIVVMSGFNASHVWRGTVSAGGTATWTDISGTGPVITPTSGTGRLPDIPVNALVIEPTSPNTMYIATDIAVFRTVNGGTSWTSFSEGLPNVAVFDMRLHDPARLLRVATHGRGMWERKLDVAAMPDVNLFVRDNLMDTGRLAPSPSGVTAAFEDPLHHVALGDTLYWWQCADVKVDALEGSPLAYQMNIAGVDYVAFESKLEHRNPQRGRVNRVYVQVHNRGIQPATNVTVKILYADASAGLPNLPADFWTAFPGNSANTSQWKPIGSAKVIPSLSPTEPTILEWDWTTPTTAADHSCLLVVVDCASDPIPVANKVLNVDSLVANERRVGLKNVHVVNALPGTFNWTPFNFFGESNRPHTVKISPATARRWGIGLLFAKNTQKDLKLNGIRRTKPTRAMLTALRGRIGAEIEKYDTTGLYVVDSATKGGALSGVALPKGTLQAMLLFSPPAMIARTGTVSIVQETNQIIVGGSTFVLKTAKKS